MLACSIYLSGGEGGDVELKNVHFFIYLIINGLGRKYFELKFFDLDIFL